MQRFLVKFLLNFVKVNIWVEFLTGVKFVDKNWNFEYFSLRTIGENVESRKNSNHAWEKRCIWRKEKIQVWGFFAYIKIENSNFFVLNRELWTYFRRHPLQVTSQPYTPRSVDEALRVDGVNAAKQERCGDEPARERPVLSDAVYAK